MLERRGGFSPRKLSGMGSVKERGKGLRRTGIRRAAAAAPGPGRGGRVPPKGCGGPRPVHEISRKLRKVLFLLKLMK